VRTRGSRAVGSSAVAADEVGGKIVAEVRRWGRRRAGPLSSCSTSRCRLRRDRLEGRRTTGVVERSRGTSTESLRLLRRGLDLLGTRGSHYTAIPIHCSTVSSSAA
jgi:hypothetical protein